MYRCLAGLGVLTLGLGLYLLPPVWAQKEEPKQEPAKEKEAEKIDITDKVRALNSDKFQAPPTEFRVGHVTPRKFDDKSITKTKDGFSIQLPSKAPIPTPTIYKGKVYASGGFHSREYYCFDAQTGKLVWAVDLDDDGPTSAVVQDDIIIFNTESCTIFALDAATGKHLWSYFLGDPLTSTPTIANGKVYTSYPANGGGGGNLEQNQNPNQNVLPPKGKKEAGEKKLAAAPPANAKPRPAATHVLACFELKTGKILWQRWIDSDVMSAPVAVDGEIYATSFAGTVYKFKQNDGTILAAHNSRATSAPVIVGNNVFLTQRADQGKDAKPEERIAGVDREKGTKNFAGEKNPALYLDAPTQVLSKLGEQSKKLDAGNGFAGAAPGAANPQAAEANIGQATVSSMQAFQGSRLLNYGNSNFNCMGDQLWCTDPVTGKERWKVKLTGDLKKEGGFLAAPPAAAGGFVFLATLKGEVLQMDPDKGDLKKTYKVGAPLRHQPAIVDGRIYVGTEDGRVVCIDTGDTKLTGWYTWGANSAHDNMPAKK